MNAEVPRVGRAVRARRFAAGAEARRVRLREGSQAAKPDTAGPQKSSPKIKGSLQSDTLGSVLA